MQVNAGRIDIGVTEQLLDVINTCAGFQQMSGETMPHSMDCHVFSDVSFLYIFFKKIFYSSRSHVGAGMIPAVKKSLFGAVSLPVISKNFKIGLRKQGISIFAAFCIANEQLHFITMNI